jgi:hypothetical protein
MKRLIVLVVAAAALLAPSAAFASGVVLKVQPSSHLVAVASSRTHAALVHTAAASRLHVGQRIVFNSRKLGNNTLKASKIRVVGRAHVVRFRGLLLAKSSSRFVVSAGGSVVTLHRGSRTTSSARDNGPQPGSTIDVQATVGSDDELDEQKVSVVTATAPGGTIEGHLALGAGTITVTSEHMSLVLKVPTGIDLTPFHAGDEVVAEFTQGTDGSLTLTRLSTADDNEDTGDDNDDNHDGDHHDGDHHDGDHGGGGGGDDD